MDINWSDPRVQKTLFRLCLITSTGQYGDNIMTSGMVTFVSLSPLMLAVSVWPGNATHANISQKRKFGISVCPDDSPILASLAGGNTGKEVDKIGALKELGYRFYKGKSIGVPMLKGAVVAIECIVVASYRIGDHTLFIGEVVEISASSQGSPLIYSGDSFYAVGDAVRVPLSLIKKADAAVAKFRKKVRH